MDYPTRLLSFVNSFYNISAKIALKEMVKSRKNLNNNIKKYYNADKTDMIDLKTKIIVQLIMMIIPIKS